MYHFGQVLWLIICCFWWIRLSLTLTSGSGIFHPQFGVLLGVAASSRSGCSYGELNRRRAGQPFWKQFVTKTKSALWEKNIVRWMKTLSAKATLPFSFFASLLDRGQLLKERFHFFRSKFFKSRFPYNFRPSQRQIGPSQKLFSFVK